MTAALIPISYVLAFLAGVGTASLLIGVAIIRATRRSQPRRIVRGGDGADLDVTGVMDSVSER